MMTGHSQSNLDSPADSSLDRQSPIWAITAYFPFDDPPHTKRRLQAFRQFRRHLQIPLAAVELSRDGRYDLSDNDAEILVQASGGALLWQKERLLNLALSSLPDHCSFVVWIDCDIVLPRTDWPAAAMRLLGHLNLIQPFRQLHFLPQGRSPLFHGKLDAPHGSAACGLVENTIPDEFYSDCASGVPNRCAPGMAWVARRESLEKHGFYDALIVGGGDKLMFCSASGRFQDYIRSLPPTGRFKEHFLDWAHRFSSVVKGRIGFLDGDAFHLWHGDLASRHYSWRYELFRRFHFDPYTDIAITDGGMWEWSSDKPEMHAFVRDYFARRASTASGPALSTLVRGGKGLVHSA